MLGCSSDPPKAGTQHCQRAAQGPRCWSDPAAHPPLDMLVHTHPAQRTLHCRERWAALCIANVVWLSMPGAGGTPFPS